MRAPAASVVQNPDSKLIVEIVAAFNLDDCLIAVSTFLAHGGLAAFLPLLMLRADCFL